jgi:thiol-disulfide isomerase/thioredoxin
LRKIATSVVLFTIFIFPILAFAGNSQILAKSGEAQVGQPAPFLSGWALDGKVFNTTKAFRDPNTHRVALVFWATWCKPCKEGLKLLNAGKAKLDAAGVSVVLVDVEEPADTVRTFLSKHPASFFVVLDQYGRSKKPYLDDGNGSVALPRTVIIGRDGKVLRIIGKEGKDYVDQIIR